MTAIPDPQPKSKRSVGGGYECDCGVDELDHCCGGKDCRATLTPDPQPTREAQELAEKIWKWPGYAFIDGRVAEEIDRFAAQHSPDTPEIEDFIIGALTEAQHQRARWGEAHDRSKSAENWYWLVGYLAGKALRASVQGDREKALHHTISAAAALSHWHEAIKRDASGSGIGEDADLQPAEAAP